jgi:hypothetical protein
MKLLYSDVVCGAVLGYILGLTFIPTTFVEPILNLHFLSGTPLFTGDKASAFIPCDYFVINIDVTNRLYLMPCNGNDLVEVLVPSRMLVSKPRLVPVGLGASADKAQEVTAEIAKLTPRVSNVPPKPMAAPPANREGAIAAAIVTGSRGTLAQSLGLLITL